MFRNFNKFASITALWGIFAIGQFTFAENYWLDANNLGSIADYRSLADSFLDNTDYQTLADVFFDNLAAMQAVDNEAVYELLPTTVNSASMLAVERNITRLSTATLERVRFVNDSGKQHRLRTARSTRGQIPAHSDLIPWFSQFGDFLHQKKKASAPGFKSDSYAFILGLDKRLTRESVFGVGIGGSFASVTSNKVQKGKANSFLATGYGSYNADDWIIAGNLGYASSEYLFSRNVLGIVADCQSHGDSFFGGLDVSKKLQYCGLNGHLDVMPFASLSIVTMSVNDYQDSLGAVRINSKDSSTVLQTLGVRFAKTKLGERGAVWTPGAYGAWVHDYAGGDLHSTTTYFNVLPMAVIGASKPADRGSFGFNANVALRHLTLYGALDFEFASRYDSEAIQGGLSFVF